MISIDYNTRIIFVPKTDTTLVQTTPFEIRQLDINTFRLALKDLEDDPDGMAYPDTHIHFAGVTVGGVTLAMVVQMINNYTVTFENGNYAVNLVGANSNIADKVNLNQVSVRAANSAGLIGSQDITDATTLLQRLLRNKQITDPVTGVMTVYADDGVTPLFTANLFEDAGGTQPYRGQGAERRERLA